MKQAHVPTKQGNVSCIMASGMETAFQGHNLNSGACRRNVAGASHSITFSIEDVHCVISGAVFMAAM